MSHRFRRFEIIEQSPPFFFSERSLCTPKTLSLNPFCSSFLVEDELHFAPDCLIPNPCRPAILDFPSPLDDFEAITDLIQIDTTRRYTSTRRVQRRAVLGSELHLQSLCDRVSALELSYDRLVKPKTTNVGDRKYTWTAEIKSPEEDGLDRKYKWTAEIKGGGKTKETAAANQKNYKWTAEFKGKGKDSPILQKYTFQASTGDAGKCKESEKKEKKEKSEKGVRLVEIGEPSDRGAVVLRQAFAKRAETVLKRKGKRKELSPQDASMMIQMSFRAYLIRRSQALRALRDLAIAKTKLKEIRALFNNFTYRRRVDRDAEERQRFSERIIVLLLTVDAIEGADIMVRATKKSMVDELEAMLDVVDPQPNKTLSLKRRTFDMPDGVIQKELAAGVTQVVQMLDHEHNGVETLASL